jgi:hypothetical protein
MVNSRLPSAPWLGRWCPAAAGSWRGWPSPPCPTCGLPVSGPWRRMQVSRWWAGWPPGRVWLALGAPEFGAVTTRMGFVMPTPLAEVPALLIRGRGRRPSARLAARAGRGHGCCPGGGRTNLQRPSHRELVQLPAQARRPRRPPPAVFASRAPPACCRAVTRPESPIGEPGGATARLAAIGVSGWTRPSRVSSPRPATTTISTSTSSFRRGWMRSPEPSRIRLTCRSSPASRHRAPGRSPAAARLARSTAGTASRIPRCSHPRPDQTAATHPCSSLPTGTAGEASGAPPSHRPPYRPTRVSQHHPACSWPRTQMRADSRSQRPWLTAVCSRHT